MYSQICFSSVKLGEVYELADAFCAIGYVDPADRISLICRKKIPVYISEVPILKSKENNVVAKLFPYDVYFFIPSFLFNRLIGEKKLCITSEDYKIIVEKYNLATDDNTKITITKLEQDVLCLRAENDKLNEINSKLNESIAISEVKIRNNKCHAVEAKMINNYASRFDYYRIAIPAVDTLRDSFKGKKYNRPEIEDALWVELDRQPQHRDAFFKVAVKEDDNKKLRPWTIDAIREKLGDMAEAQPGRPKKN